VLLREKEVTAEEIEVIGDTSGWDTMIERTGGWITSLDPHR
jgi:hypothetical protein